MPGPTSLFSAAAAAPNSAESKEPDLEVLEADIKKKQESYSVNLAEELVDILKPKLKSKDPQVLHAYGHAARIVADTNPRHNEIYCHILTIYLHRFSENDDRYYDLLINNFPTLLDIESLSNHDFLFIRFISFIIKSNLADNNEVIFNIVRNRINAYQTFREQHNQNGLIQLADLTHDLQIIMSEFKRLLPSRMQPEEKTGEMAKIFERFELLARIVQHNKYPLLGVWNACKSVKGYAWKHYEVDAILQFINQFIITEMPLYLIPEIDELNGRFKQKRRIEENLDGLDNENLFPIKLSLIKSLIRMKMELFPNLRHTTLDVHLNRFKSDLNSIEEGLAMVTLLDRLAKLRNNVKNNRDPLSMAAYKIYKHACEAIIKGLNNEPLNATQFNYLLLIIDKVYSTLTMLQAQPRGLPTEEFQQYIRILSDYAASRTQVDGANVDRGVVAGFLGVVIVTSAVAIAATMTLTPLVIAGISLLCVLGLALIIYGAYKMYTGVNPNDTRSSVSHYVKIASSLWGSEVKSEHPQTTSFITRPAPM